MEGQSTNTKILQKMMFRLLPVQILLAAIGQINGIVSSFFASNFVGVEAMSAVGLYSPINLLLVAISIMLVGGSVVLCGRYMGQNEPEKMQNIYSLSLILSILIAVVFIAVFLICGIFDLTGLMTRDPVVRPLYNRYLLGMSIGILPLLLGNQLAAFLSMENRNRRMFVASLVYIVVNFILNFLFVQVLSLSSFGLALASSLGLWAYFCVEVQFFLSGRSTFHIRLKKLNWKEIGDILKIGVNGALTTGYQTIRGLIVNKLLEIFVGTVGISALATANNLLGIFWAVPTGMIAVSRMMFSISIGEEDRQTLTDIMRIMFKRFVVLMCIIMAGIILFAVPLTRLFYQDPSQTVYMMTVWGIRLLPICMPLAIVCTHFVGYRQASGDRRFVLSISLIDGVVCVAVFTALLVRFIGVNGVYIANVINGIVCVLIIIGYAWVCKKHFPKTMDDLMTIPDDFGAPESDRLDLSIQSMEEVVTLSRQIQSFCREKGIDERRAYLAGLAMEEMAGNIVNHGFAKDKKAHSIDVRVVYKDNDVILRLKDDCVPFDPGDRLKLEAGEDITKNIGIRMVFKMARDVQYQNILGLNVLTVRM